ncbi:MAG TPA: hypothetical protein PKB09_02380 [Candidatus Saccharibacteria bacterium]|nr:hypothetical protein [Candidatus Saccharibacteria bacterium]
MDNKEEFIALQDRISCYSFSDDYCGVLLSLAGIYPETEYVEPLPLIRNDGDSTLFTSSGIQYMNQFIFGDLQPTDKSYVISQPVVRMNYLPGVKLGSYTSFINFGSMQLNTSLPDHNVAREEFADLLSSVSGKNVERHERQEETYLRDGLEYTTLQENYLIDDLDVGDSLFHDIRLSDGSSMTMSEMGGGLERLLFGCSPHFLQETTGIPAIDDDNVVSVDAFRGAVLIASNKVIPSNNNQGYQLRRLAKLLPVSSPESELYLDALAHDDSTYQFWSRMGGVITSNGVTVETVRSEIWRNINLNNLRISGTKSKAKMNLSEDPELFAKRYSLQLEG